MKKQQKKSHEFAPIETGPVNKMILQDWRLLFHYVHLCASLTRPESDYHRGERSYFARLLKPPAASCGECARYCGSNLTK
jgi:hypothetical protein